MGNFVVALVSVAIPSMPTLPDGFRIPLAKNKPVKKDWDALIPSRQKENFMARLWNE